MAEPEAKRSREKILFFFDLFFSPITESLDLPLCSMIGLYLRLSTILSRNSNQQEILKQEDDTAINQMEDKTVTELSIQ